MSATAPAELVCGLAGCLKSYADDDGLFWHRDLVHPGWDDEYDPEPPPTVWLAALAAAAPEPEAVAGAARESSLLALLSDEPPPRPRPAIPHEHLEADGRFHPKHWCAWCGQNRGREPMKVVVHHLTEADALKCIDEAACLRRAGERQRDAA